MPVPENLYIALFIDEERLQKLQRWAEIASKLEEEDTYLCIELSKQLQEMVAKVLDDRLDDTLAEIKLAAHGVDLNPWRAPMRQDMAEPWPDVNALLENAPTSERYFVVPEIK